MNGVKGYFKKEEKEKIDNIEIYLKLNGFELVDTRYSMNYDVKEKKIKRIYRYIYKKKGMQLEICFEMYQLKLESIYVTYRYENNGIFRDDVVYNINQLRDLLLEFL